MFWVSARLLEKALFVLSFLLLGLRYARLPALFDAWETQSPGGWAGRQGQTTRPALLTDQIEQLSELEHLCSDRLGLFPGVGTLGDVLGGWANRTQGASPELQELRRKKYFIAALQRDVADIFPAWQREVVKVLYVLGDDILSNVFVSIYESDSGDLTHFMLDAFKGLLQALGVPHRIEIAPKGGDGALGQSTLSRIERLAHLRNKALQPLYGSDISYDSVLYLNDVLFCAADALDLLTVVRPGAGINADMSCAVDYIERDPTQPHQDSVRLYDTWVAHDMLGINMVNDLPYMCHDESQAVFDKNVPVEVFSCWNGMVAIDADVFQQYRLRFRSAHQYECQMSECELIVRDLRALDRGRIFMVPTARTAYDWEAFRVVARWDNSGLPQPLSLVSTEPLPEPTDAVCCALDRSSSLVLLETCLLQRRWRLSYELFGVPVAATPDFLDADFSHVPADEAGLVAAAHRAFRFEQGLSGGGVASVTAAVTVAGAYDAAAATAVADMPLAASAVSYGSLYVTGNGAAGGSGAPVQLAQQLLSVAPDSGDVAKAAFAAAGSGVTAATPAIPKLLVHWGGEAHLWADDARNVMSLSMLSYVGANHDFELRLVDDRELSAWIESAAAPPWPAAAGVGSRSAAAGSVEGGGAGGGSNGVEHAYRNRLVRIGCEKLRYMHEHGGVYVPTASWAGRNFSGILLPQDELVLGVAEDFLRGERHLLFLAAAPRSPALAAMLARVEESLRAPAETYRRAWRSAPSHLSADVLEFHYFTGVEMMLDVLAAEEFSAQQNIRIMRYRLEDVMFEVARPEAICSGLKARNGARRATARKIAAGLAMAACDGEECDSPVHFDPEVPFQVLFRGHLHQDQRLGIHRNVTRDSLGFGSQLVQGQYLVPAYDAPGAAKFDPLWQSHPVPECYAPRPGDDNLKGGGGRGGGRCFLWLEPGGQLSVYSGLGLMDAAARPVKVLAPAAAEGSKVTFSWMVLQVDGNVVIYNAIGAAGQRAAEEAAEGATVDVEVGAGADGGPGDRVDVTWSTRSEFGEDCLEGSRCRELADFVLRPDGSVELRRGVSEMMRTYVQYGLPAVRRLRECIWRSNSTATGPPRPPPGALRGGCQVPQVLGLVTFPNSGTSFTLDATMEVTGHNVYTSYIGEVEKTGEASPEMQELCGVDACRELGMCQLGRGIGAHLAPPPLKGALQKTHVANYAAGYICKDDSEAKFRAYLQQGHDGRVLNHYGYLRLFRNPFDNMVARFRLLAEQGRLPGLKYDKESFLHDGGVYPRRDIHTFLNWHLLANRAFKASGLPAELLTYEEIYIKPQEYIQKVARMLGWRRRELAPHRLRAAQHRITARGVAMHDNEMLPIYIDTFYDVDTIRSIAAAIHAVLDHTACLTEANYLLPDVGPIPIFRNFEMEAIAAAAEAAGNATLTLEETLAVAAAAAAAAKAAEAAEAAAAVAAEAVAEAAAAAAAEAVAEAVAEAAAAAATEGARAVAEMATGGLSAAATEAAPAAVAATVTVSAAGSEPLTTVAVAPAAAGKFPSRSAPGPAIVLTGGNVTFGRGVAVVPASNSAAHAAAKVPSMEATVAAVGGTAMTKAAAPAEVGAAAAAGGDKVRLAAAATSGSANLRSAAAAAAAAAAATAAAATGSVDFRPAVAAEVEPVPGPVLAGAADIRNIEAATQRQ